MSSKTSSGSPWRDSSVATSLSMPFRSGISFLTELWQGLSGEDAATGDKRRRLDGDQRSSKRRRLGDASRDVFDDTRIAPLSYDPPALESTNSDLPGVDKVMAWMEVSRRVDAPGPSRPAKRRRSEDAEAIPRHRIPSGGLPASYSVPDLLGQSTSRRRDGPTVQARPRSDTLRAETAQTWEAFKEEERRQAELERREADAARIATLEYELKRLRGELEEAKTLSQSQRAGAQVAPPPPAPPPPPPMADVNSARWRRNAPASGMGAALAGARSANAQHPRHRASMSSMPGINDMQAFLAELRTVKLRKVHSRQDKGKGRADGGLKGVLEMALDRKFANARTPARPATLFASEWSASPVEPAPLQLEPESAAGVGSSRDLATDADPIGKRAALSPSRLGLDSPTPGAGQLRPEVAFSTTPAHAPPQRPFTPSPPPSRDAAAPPPSNNRRAISPVCRTASPVGSPARNTASPLHRPDPVIRRTASPRKTPSTMRSPSTTRSPAVVTREVPVVDHDTPRRLRAPTPRPGPEAVVVKEESTSEDEIGLLGVDVGKGKPPVAIAPAPASALAQRRRSGELLSSPISSRPSTPSRTRRGAAAALRASTTTPSQPVPSSSSLAATGISPTCQGSDKENHRRGTAAGSTKRLPSPGSSPDPIGIGLEEPTLSGYGTRTRGADDVVGYGISPAKVAGSGGASRQ